MDLGIVVIVHAVVVDLVPVRREIEVPRVFGVVAAVAEPAGLGLLGLEGDQLAELGVVGIGRVLRARARGSFRTGCRPGRGSRLPSRQPELYSKPVVWQVTHSASKIVLGLGSCLSDSNAWACLVVDQNLIRVGMTFLAGLGADEGRAGGTVDIIVAGKVRDDIRRLEHAAILVLDQRLHGRARDRRIACSA